MYHLSIKPVARASGRSATAAAAYRAACLIEDVRTGDIHDYSRKVGVAHSEILLPAGSPSWEEDRAALWNAAELAEKRIDSRVAREYEVAIPKELSLDQGIALIRDFGHSLIERYGVAVDFNLHQDHRQHWDGSEKGFNAFHAHVLTSTRQLGRGGFGEKAAPELSDTKRKSLGLDTGAAEIERVRALWAVVANRHLEEAGQQPTLDHRSFKDQGIDREPTLHMGPVATALERGTRGREPAFTRLGDANRRIAAAFREGEMARQALNDISQSLLVLDGDIALALGERERLVKAEAKVWATPTQAQAPPAAHPSKGATTPVPPPDYLRLRDAEIAVLVGSALEQAIDAHHRHELDAQLRLRASESTLASAELPLLHDELRAVEARAPVAPSGLTAVFKRKGYEALHMAHENELNEARKRVDAALRGITTPEKRHKAAMRLADARIERQLPLSLNALDQQRARAAWRQQNARILANRFAVHAKTYGALAETDPRWQVQPAWLQGEIKDFLKLSREGGADEFLQRLQQRPDRLKALEAAVTEGKAKANALPRDKGRER